MPDELNKKTRIDLSGKIFSLFQEHRGEALSFDEIADSLLGEFDIEKVNAWRPYSYVWIYKNVRTIYNRLSIIVVELGKLVANGLLETVNVQEDLLGPVGGVSHYFTSYYMFSNST